MYYIYGKISLVIYMSASNFELTKIAYKNYFKHYNYDNLAIMDENWNEVF